MNLILLSEHELDQHYQAELTDYRAQHIINILRSEPGDQLAAGIINGMLGTATITTIDNGAITLTLELSSPPPAKRPLTIITALPRPKALRRIVKTVTELGAEKLILLNASRVEKSYWQTPLLKEASLQQFIREGLSQAKDTIPLKIRCETRFKPFVEDTLPGLLRDRPGFAAHPYTEQACPKDINHAATLIIGPEGGFIPYEIEKLQQAGCQMVSLGPRIQRVETAITVLTTQLFPF